jgi:hypothetical protein
MVSSSTPLPKQRRYMTFRFYDFGDLKEKLEEVNLAVEFIRNRDGSISGRSRTREEAAELALNVVIDWLILIIEE